MRRILMSLVILYAVLAAWSLHEAPAQAPKQKVLKHMVLYKFKDDQTPAQVQEVIDTFAGMAKKIDTVVALEHGPNVSKEGKSDGLTYGFCVTFKDEAGLAAYIKHPAHDAYVNVVKDRREKVIVFDYWAEK